LLVIGLAATAVGALAPAAYGESTSHKVAYVYDKTLFPCIGGCGLNDTAFKQGSIFTNAVAGKIAKGEQEGTYTPSGGEEVTLKNITLEELDANSHLLEEEGFDTAIVYQTCKIAEHPKALAQINAFLESAHKVMIFDADGCSPGGKGEPNWSGFLFPFATNNPGPEGAEGPYTAVEPSSLTTGLSVGTQENDAVGDANIFTSSSVHWFQAIAATNVHKVNGTVMAYARSAAGGLALYEGEDFWFSDGPDPHLKQVFDNMLNQRWNPDKLPGTTFVCTTCASTLTTRLSSTLVPAGTPVTDSATVVGASGPGTATGKVTFTIYSDPHCQLPVAGHAQTVVLSTGSATTGPIALPAGTYYLQAQYFGDANNEAALSACGSEVLRVVPINPPITKRVVVHEETGEIEWEVEFPEPGELEFEGEILEAAELARVHLPGQAFLVHASVAELAGGGFEAKHKSSKCRKGFVKKHNKCVSRAPVKYGKGKLAITAPGIYKLHFKPSGTVLAALKKGKTLNVRLTLVFTPASTTVHLTKTASAKLHLKKKKHHGKHK
jgi:hypothetical protein